MKITLIRRTGRALRKRGGGIIRSADLITSTLRDLKCEVQELSDKNPTPISPDTDLTWLYGSYDCVLDIILQTRKLKIPLLINSAFDATTSRSKSIRKLYKELDSENLKDIFLNVFTLEAEHHPHLESIRSQVISIPKTVRICPDTSYPNYSSREGICLGDIGKISRSRLTRGIDVEHAIENLHRSLPNTNLYAYQQYGNSNDSIPSYVKIVPYMREHFLPWMSERKLYISLVSHETFAMVPQEAQSVGTPVLYRHMPQSLSSYIGISGIPFRSERELSQNAKRIYENTAIWDLISRSGIHNSKARGLPYTGAALLLALSSVIDRFSSTNH